MFVNTGKTKVMILNKKEGSTSSVVPVFTYDGVELEIVSDFKYLGVIFSVYIHNTYGIIMVIIDIVRALNTV